MKRISVLIPTLNEAQGIGSVLERMPNVYEVIVIDGNSKDDTVKIAKKHGAKVILEPRRGYGRAYLTGLKHAKGDIIATLDGDGSYDPNYIKDMLKIIEDDKADFVSANRLKKLRKGSMPLFRGVGNILISQISNILFSTNIYDNQSGMWVFTRELLNKMTLKEEGMPFSGEIKLEAWKHGRVVEYEIEFFERKGKRTMNALKQGYSIFSFFLERLLR